MITDGWWKGDYYIMKNQRCVVRGIALSSLLSCRLLANLNSRGSPVAPLGPPVLTRKQKRPRVNSLVCDRAAAFCAAGPPEALSWMSRLVTQAAKRERELARAHSQRLKQATLSLPGESVTRVFADRGALEGYPSHYTSLEKRSQKFGMWNWTISLNYTSVTYLIATAIVKHLGDIWTAEYFQTSLHDV